MSKRKPELILDFGEYGGLVQIKEPAELQTWFQQEVSKWQWLQPITQTQPNWNALNNPHLRNQIAQFSSQWQSVIEQPDQVKAKLSEVKRYLEQQLNSFLLSTGVRGQFVLSLREQAGDMVAAGAYMELAGNPQPMNQPFHPQFMDGLIQGFLFKHEIDWVATEHRKTLERLKKQYTGNISEQTRKLTHLEDENAKLNKQFSEALEQKNLKLDELHKVQSEAFDALVKEHKKNLEAIEQAYDQKLALLKPVEYWEKRRVQHQKASRGYAVAAGIAGFVLFGALGGVAYELFLNLQPNEHPKPWQIGVFAVAAFAAIWFERILVRLFMSNMHLKTDAEERKTMLQTYLAIIREGSEFAPEEKKLILERLFLPASDGLVKDDAAPPMLLEWLSRRGS
jgi:hypothetical protein